MTPRPRRLRPDSQQRTKTILTQTKGAPSAHGSVAAARPVDAKRQVRQYQPTVPAANVVTGTQEDSTGISLAGTVGGTGSSYAAGSGAVAVGNSSTAAGVSAVAVGLQANASDDDSVAIGSGARSPYRSVAIGSHASSDPTAGKAVVIGYNAGVGPSSYETIAIGNLAYAEGNDAICIGTASATAASAIAIGVGSEASTQDTIAIGRNAETDADRAIAIGYGTFTNSSAGSATSVGTESGVHGQYGTALGARTVADQPGSVAIGCDSSGSGAVAGVTDQIVLGTNSHATIINGKLVIADGSGGLHQIVVSTGGALSTVAYP